MQRKPHATDTGYPSGLDLDSLLHPAKAYARPSDVLHDPDLTLYEKRAILASWASDACAMEAAPALRVNPGGGEPVSFDEIMDALRILDDEFRSRTVSPTSQRTAGRADSRRSMRLSGNDRDPAEAL